MSVQATAGLGVDCDACSTDGCRIVDIAGSRPRTVGPPVADVEPPLSDAPAAERVTTDGFAAEGQTIVELVAPAPAGLVNSSGAIERPLEAAIQRTSSCNSSEYP